MSKIKVIFAILLSSFIGIISNPEMMLASDSVALSGIDSSKVVKTEPLPEPAQIITEKVLAPVAGAATQNVATMAPVVRLVSPAAAAVPANNIKIAGKTIALEWTESSSRSADYNEAKAWYFASGAYIYGHNSNPTFGVLNTMYKNGTLDGLSFTVTMNGVARTYTVDHAREFTRAALSARMNGIVNGTTGSSMVIQTCYDDGKFLLIYAK